MWKLSGLFDLTFDQSVQAGVADLEAAMAEHGNDNLVIYGYSQGAVVANVEKRKLAEQYPDGTEAPDVDFVLGGDPNLPNGGFLARFPGLYIPILDFSFNGPAATDTQFDTVEINRQYDFMSDFPLYPINVICRPERLIGLLLRAHIPVRRQPGARCVDVAGLPGHPRRHQLLLLRDRRTCRCSLRCACWGCPSR